VTLSPGAAICQKTWGSWEMLASGTAEPGRKAPPCEAAGRAGEGGEGIAPSREGGPGV
jgi:hypothetical protein